MGYLESMVALLAVGVLLVCSGVWVFANWVLKCIKNLDQRVSKLEVK